MIIIRRRNSEGWPFAMNRMQSSLALMMAMACGLIRPCLAVNPGPILPAGTRLHVELTTTLSTKDNEKGDPFEAQVEDPIFADGEELIPAGSTAYGHITYVQSPKRMKGVAEMRLTLDGVTTKSGLHYNLSAALSNDEAGGNKVSGDEGTIEGQGKSKKEGAKDTGIGAAAGAGVGAIAAGGPGALYGAGLGAIAGAIRMLGKKHKDLVLHAGTELTFVTSRAVAPSPAPPGVMVIHTRN
jgi:outer membrane lipoprotein SlyB